MLHGLLGNSDGVTNQAKQIDLAQMQAQGSQVGIKRKVPPHFRIGKLCHSDEPPLAEIDVAPKCRFITARCLSMSSRSSTLPLIEANIGNTLVIALDEN